MKRHDVERLVNEVFRRISSGGLERVDDLFTPDGVYEGVYAEQYIAGAEAIAAMLADAIPAALSPFRQWPIGIVYDEMKQAAAVEYVSEGIALHDGSIYANRYTGLMRFKDDRIAYWREYYDPALFAAAVGPGFAAIMAERMPGGSMPTKLGHNSVIDT
jgi:ketosteroid isomerase-like protein